MTQTLRDHPVGLRRLAMARRRGSLWLFREVGPWATGLPCEIYILSSWNWRPSQPKGSFQNTAAPVPRGCREKIEGHEKPRRPLVPEIHPDDVFLSGQDLSVVEKLQRH